MTGERFLQGAIILSVAGMVSKLLGALYRIPLARILGGEGMGLYQMAYPIYTSILALSTAGIPVAISILVAEKLANGDYRGAKRVFTVSLALLSLTGLIFAYLVFSGASFLAHIVLQEPRALYPIAAIAPAIFFTAVVSAFRGYFQGYQVMVPTAVSQVVEQLARVTTVLTGAIVLLPYGIELAAGAATFGAVTGGAAALVVLAVFFLRMPQRRGGKGFRVFQEESTWSLVSRIIKIALPLSVGGLVMPMMQVVDALIVPIRLQAAGMTASRATELFGQLTGMAGSLINLPTIITISLAVSLVPAVSEAVAKRRRPQAISRIAASLRITILLCLPAAAGLAVLAKPISVLLYDVAEVGIPLAYLAPGILFLGLYQTTSGALQGLSKTFIPVTNLLIGLVLKSFLNYYLTAIPGVDVRGAAIATVSAFFLAFVLNFFALRQLIGLKLAAMDSLFLPGLATGLMAVAIKHLYQFSLGFVPGSFATLAAVFAGIFIFFFSLLMLGGLTVEDVAMVPGVGKKVASFLQKIRLLR